MMVFNIKKINVFKIEQELLCFGVMCVDLL
jgi:hypothetical protein